MGHRFTSENDHPDLKKPQYLTLEKSFPLWKMQYTYLFKVSTQHGTYGESYIH